MSVKQEPYDDAEIQELAEKMMEQSRSRMQMQQKPNQSISNNSGAGGGGIGIGINIGNGGNLNQIGINSFLNENRRPKNNIALTLTTTTTTTATTTATTTTATTMINCNDNENAIDEESVRGRFGWETISNQPIPYIYRNGEKYVSVRMVENKVLNKYMTYLHNDIYNCTCIRSYYVTEAESRLLNEINFKHCEYQYGREHFSLQELIVRLSDAIEFYHFLASCYTKLAGGDFETLGRSGFIRINKESVVPYTVYDDQKYVPLFYFEGETENLKQRATKLEGWDLSYLKFCCKVQGIRNELFAHDSCSVISLNDIKNYFPPGTLFEDYWPKKSADSQLLITGSGRPPQMIKWTRQPPQPPIQTTITHPSHSPKALVHPKVATGPIHGVHTYNTGYALGGAQHPYHPAVRTPSATAIRSTYPPATGNRHQIRSPNYFNSLGQGPPPLVPATQTNSTLAQYHNHNNNTTVNATSNYMITNDTPTINHGYQDDDPMPPMIPIRHIIPNYFRNQLAQVQRYQIEASRQNTVQRDLQNNYGVTNRQSMIINQQPAHQPITRTQLSPYNNDERMQNGQLTLDDVNCKLTTIAEPLTSSSHIPYKMQKALVEGKMLPCINMKPYVYTELLVTLPDVITNFFNNIPVQSCQRVMKVLGIELYKPNNYQTNVLMESGKCSSLNEVVPLVQVRNVIDYMPQLKYMLGGVLSSLSSNKRPRNS